MRKFLVAELSVVNAVAKPHNLIVRDHDQLLVIRQHLMRRNRELTFTS